ncbi:hypothetical protein [Phenylobacterium sp.]|uniref:hypothetical protein n=1 Tax=Phenylobacterium sp. TaxID=1871053 RepID=UPI002DED8405|nr:hypothetical protein [Phenylobacterium sp.]
MSRVLGVVTARRALWLVLAAGLVLMLAVDLPGHLSYDSVIQLHEGHFHRRETWAPAIFAWLLGLSDAVIPGTSLYVAASGLLFFSSLAGLAALRGKVSWLGVATAALIALTPQVLIYQGIVWKDICFANCALAGATCLALALSGWEQPRRRWPWLAGALISFSVASLVRQNGILIPLFCALALGWVGSRGQWRRGAAWMFGALLAIAALMQVLQVAAVPQFGVKDKALSEGVRIVQNYDMTGAVTLDPSYRLSEIEKAKPGAAATIRARSRLNWSPDRIDFLDRDPVLGTALNSLDDGVARRQWLDLIIHHPGLYLRLRWMDFVWVFATPNPDRCLPVYTGVDAPAPKMRDLGIAHRYSKVDGELYNYDTWFMDTPLQRHWTYAIVALAVAGVLLLRREPADLAVVGLMLGSLAMTASFFVISLACDYRYLYFLDVSALAGLFYLVVDRPRFRRRRPAG